MSKLECLYPVENLYRQYKSLSGNWYFSFDTEDGRNRENGISRQMMMPVPANLQAVFEGTKEATYCGTVWYERSVLIPKSWLGEDVFLRFDGLSQRAVVYVNGAEAGRHEGAFMPCILMVTRHLRYGEENTIVVKLNNELSPYRLPIGNVKILSKGQKINKANFDFPVPWGLHEPVHIYTTPQNRIVGVSVQTTELTKEKAILSYAAQVQGNCLVTATMRDREGRVIATGVGGTGTLTVDNPKLWSIGEGYLYTIDFEVNRLGKQHDLYTLPVGIRTLSLVEGKLYLNGESLSLQGTTLAKDIVLAGAGQLKRALRAILQDGYSCVLSGGCPLPEKVVSMADEMGLLVVEELPAAGMTFAEDKVGEAYFSRAEVKSRLLEGHMACVQEVLLRDENHPSILGWSLFYEPATVAKEDEEYFRAIFEYARSLDKQQRLLGLSLAQGAEVVSEYPLKYVDWLVLTTWRKAATASREEIVDDAYQGLVNWQVKYPSMPLMLVLPRNIGQESFMEEDTRLTIMPQLIGRLDF